VLNENHEDSKAGGVDRFQPWGSFLGPAGQVLEYLWLRRTRHGDNDKNQVRESWLPEQ
jgi:hypothetical protein